MYIVLIAILKARSTLTPKLSYIGLAPQFEIKSVY